ncbi:MAG: dephospho-CoA kinase [Gammaproteobacteria bacterium]|nr:dephospho-CoA kinase [Gammaproteobacteria bacterium]
MLHKSTPTLFGLTGGIASGKTTVANYLGNLGAHIIDTDIIAREVVEPNSKTTCEIRKLLGSNYFLSDGNMNRGAIKKLIFTDELIKQQYEAIILPAIRNATLDAIMQMPIDSCYGLLVVPLLFEKGLNEYTSYNINVDIPTEIQIQRAISRQPSDKYIIEQIIEAQMSREDRNAHADFIVNNHQSLDTLYKDLDLLHQKLCQL